MYIKNGVLEIDDSITSIFFTSDLHGELTSPSRKIMQYQIKNAVIIVTGDCGIGFEKLGYYKNMLFPKITKILKNNNCRIVFMAGNHDNPDMFDGKSLRTKYIIAIPTYTVIKTCNKNILCVSGGISIDRKYRQVQDFKRLQQYSYYHKCSLEKAKLLIPLSYWENEQVKYQEKINEKIDIICSHSAPNFCYPFNKGDIVRRFAEYDDKLLDDIEEERNILTKVYNDYKDTITHWYYGHYHQSMYQKINNCIFRLLDIEELCQHVTDDNNIL